MEQLIHYVWKHKLFPLTGLKTTDGQEVEVIDTGLHNHNAGPDFFNAKVKIRRYAVGRECEIHDRASDWFLHRHDRDPNYNNVILHVAESIDVDVKTRRGRLSATDATASADGCARTLRRTTHNRRISGLLSYHSESFKTNGSFVDECLTDWKVGTEDRGDSPTSEGLWRLLGSSLLRNTCPQLWFRHQWGRFRDMG